MSTEPPDRSEEEREAARLARERAREERDRRQAERDERWARKAKPAKAAPPPPPPDPEPAVADNPRYAWAKRHSDETEPRRSARERVDELLAARSANAADPRPRRRGRWILLGLALLAAVFVAYSLITLYQPGKGDGEGNVTVTIPRGAGVGEIGDLLEAKEVVADAVRFEIRVRLAGKSGDLKPGIYELRRDMSYGAAIDALDQGPSPNLIDVTFPEGIALREIAPRVEKAGVRGSYVRASKRSSLLNPRRYGAPHARDLEGFLFPATYQLRKGATARVLVDKQAAAFKREFAKVDLKAARRANLTPYDVLIIASLVEREAQVDKERPIVASVVYNRLREGMNLGIDATVRYAANNWTKPVTRSQLASSSPYNTYNHRGLPPGPIGNPGLASIQAAAKPARTKYLYYVVKPGTCGEHNFAESAAQHDRNVAKYEAAREARGGKSPTNC